MSRRTPTLTVAFTLAAGALATHDAAAQRTRDDGNLYQVARPHYDDWTIEGFRDLDQNRDGRVTTAEWTYDREDFRRADHNRDGVLSQRELLGEAADEPVDNAADGRRRRRCRPDIRFSSISIEPRRSACRRSRVVRASRRPRPPGRNRDGYLTAPGRWLGPPDDTASTTSPDLDADRDGVIARGEWPESAAGFERLDTNHGRLTFDRARRRST